MAIEGVDYTTAQRPTVAALKAAGKQFACRYGGPGGGWKQIDLAEVRELTAAGIAIVANAEGTADGLKGGRSVGIAWAQDAEAHFKALGMPADRPIYFSVDFDTTSSHWDELDAAFDGIASVIGRGRTGVYGEYSILKHLAAVGKATWFWQTYAWSGGQWFTGNHIEQYKNGVPLGGGTVDLNRAKTADYGQWGLDDMQLSDSLKSYGGLDVNVGQALTTLLVRTDYLVNKSGLVAKVEQLLAKAASDPGTTVTMSDEDRAALAVEIAEGIRSEVAAIPQETADLVHADLAD
ncbi:DUF1906 domain-containing protein [Lysinibacillus fusiformis]|uniref:DUF1906 domain-containing protein n=1 Tax=Lysinibacillus fusiformis TaxID=28031 RepID=UPI003D02731D